MPKMYNGVLSSRKKKSEIRFLPFATTWMVPSERSQAEKDLTKSWARRERERVTRGRGVGETGRRWSKGTGFQLEDEEVLGM